MRNIPSVSQWALVFFLCASLFGVSPGLAQAETNEVRIGMLYGVGYIPLLVMRENKLLEKHAEEAGLGQVKVTYINLAGGGITNAALLSGSLDFASGGLSPPILLWDKSKGDVKMVSAVCTMPEILTTRNPKVKTIADFTEADKIALPAVKVSDQARLLQMAASKVFGIKNYNKLDPLTVSLSHPDGMAAMLSGGEINSHFSVPPFQDQELDTPGVHKVLSSYDVMGGPTTATVYWTTNKFRTANPKMYAAFLSALKEAIAIVNKDKRAAAEFYVKTTKSSLPAAKINKIISDLGFEYSMTPKNTMKMAEFLYEIGAIKTKPSSWKDLFFPEVHNLPGGS